MTWRTDCRRSLIVGALALGLWLPPLSQALSTELENGRSDRTQSQDQAQTQSAASEASVPPPETAGADAIALRLRERDLQPGSPMLIRIFKAESELEVWMEKGGSYVLFDTYAICHWSGGLGPKLRRGDKQAPEGFYTLTSSQLHHSGRWPASLNLGYPNAFDRSQARSGSHILVHGGCTSVGCFAMTNPVMAEIYALTSAALKAGHEHVPVHVFPFRMTEANLQRYRSEEWQGFWNNLKLGYDHFERTRRPSKVGVCQGRYLFEDGVAGSAAGPLAVCRETAAAILELELAESIVPPGMLMRLLAEASSGAGLSALVAAPGLGMLSTKEFDIDHFRRPGETQRTASRRYSCSPALASCRRFIALQERVQSRRLAGAAGRKRLTSSANRGPRG